MSEKAASRTSVHDIVRRPIVGREWVDKQGRKWVVINMVRPGCYAVIWRGETRHRVGEMNAVDIRRLTEAGHGN